MLWIRADGGKDVGAGHLMRCLTISNAYVKLAGNRGKTCFICADSESAQIPISSGRDVKILNTDLKDMESELKLLEELIDKDDTLLVDSYYVTQRYMKRLSGLCHVVYMDDLADECYRADAVINYNAYAKELPYGELYKGTKTEFLLGGEYAPVREQFTDTVYVQRDDIKRILITAGGGDTGDVAERIYDRIYEKYEDGIIVDIVSGRYSEGGGLSKKAQTRDTLNIWHNVRDMAALMTKCDAAITAGGSTVYELMTLGVPFICFSCAYNQERNTEYIGREGIAYNAGMYHRDPNAVLKRIEEYLEELIHNRTIRGVMSANEKKRIDGKGASRIAEYILKYESRT